MCQLFLNLLCPTATNKCGSILSLLSTEVLVTDIYFGNIQGSIILEVFAKLVFIFHLFRTYFVVVTVVQEKGRGQWLCSGWTLQYSRYGKSWHALLSSIWKPSMVSDSSLCWGLCLYTIQVSQLFTFIMMLYFSKNLSFNGSEVEFMFLVIFTNFVLKTILTNYCTVRGSLAQWLDLKRLFATPKVPGSTPGRCRCEFVCFSLELCHVFCKGYLIGVQSVYTCCQWLNKKPKVKAYAFISTEGSHPVDSWHIFKPSSLK